MAQRLWSRLYDKLPLHFRNINGSDRYKKYYKRQDNMGENVYRAKNLGEFSKKFNFIHHILKYRILMPAMGFIKWKWGKHFENNISKEVYDKNFRIFDKVFTDTIVQWHDLYLPKDPAHAHYKKTNDPSKILEKRASVLLLDMKNILLAIMMNDTAYKEMFNMLMHNIAQAMMKEYKGKKVRHIMYTQPHIYDVNYFIATKINELVQANTNKYTQLVPPEKIKAMHQAPGSKTATLIDIQRIL